MNIPDFHPERYDHTAYIVGGGPSLKTFDWSLLDDEKKFVVAINNAYMRLPNAQILYCTDPPWIKQHEEDLKNFKGLKYQGVLNLDKPPKMDVIDMQWHLTGPQGFESREGSLKHGSNSPYAALNMLTVHLGFKNIYLLGLDMKWAQKGKRNTSHWHSDEKPHIRIDGEAIYTKMRMNYKTIIQPLKRMGVEVINVNTPEGTDLEVFPIKSVEEVFGL